MIMSIKKIKVVRKIQAKICLINLLKKKIKMDKNSGA